MTTKQLAELRKEVYNEVFRLDGTAQIDEINLRLLELYDTKKAIAEFNETPLQWVEKPIKKAKEIALQAAIEYHKEISTNAKGIVDMAETIYQWLIKPDANDHAHRNKESHL